MLDIIFSIVLYAIFGFVGIYGFSKISFVKKNFGSKQNAIYLTIFYLIFSFFIGQTDPGNTGIAFQIGFGIGNCIAAIVGAGIASYFSNKYKFVVNKKFFYVFVWINVNRSNYFVSHYLTLAIYKKKLK